METESKSLSNNIQAKMEQYRNDLLKFNMSEPTKRKLSFEHLYFYKPMTELTAFIVNLQGKDFHVEVVYGYTSTAFTRFAGDENALVEWGVSDEDITIREKAIICNEADENNAKSKIAEMYAVYQKTLKDDLLLFAKEKRKAFIHQIHTKLKPLGFNKKSKTWTRTLTDTYYIMFNAQKSAFSDEYYFNLFILYFLALRCLSCHTFVFLQKTYQRICFLYTDMDEIRNYVYYRHCNNKRQNGRYVIAKFTIKNREQIRL